MTFQDSARAAVLQAATDLERKSQEIGIMRSVDATESSQWLKEVVQRLREACTDPPMASPPEAGEGTPTLPDGLHRASILLKSWEIGGGKNHETMAEAFSEICAAHDALLANLRTKEVYSGVVRERDQQLKFIEQIKKMKDGDVDAPEKPTHRDGRPFRAMVVAHDWRGTKGLCIGADGYSPDDFVVLRCSEEDKKRFPVGTKFDLTKVSE